jgi:hypothetical protein
LKTFKKIEYTSDKYSFLKSVQIDNGHFMKEHLIGSRKNLYRDKNLIASTSISSNLSLGGINQKQFISFLGQFNKELYKQFSKNENLYSLNINFYGTARHKNKNGWSSIEDKEQFYNIDLSSAYWQVAHKLGYISTKFYLKYKDYEAMKSAKRYCISFLGRKNKAIYYKDGMVANTIECDTNILKLVYGNIRKQLYCYIDSVLNGIEDYVEYNIDGVIVKTKDLDMVCTKFNELGLEYKITLCVKISDSSYYHGKTLKIY